MKYVKKYHAIAQIDATRAFEKKVLTNTAIARELSPYSQKNKKTSKMLLYLKTVNCVIKVLKNAIKVYTNK